MPDVLIGDSKPTGLWRSAVIAVALVVALFAWQGDRGFDLADEGYLWYGSQRILAGEIPIRDFMAYDPARYYWAAAWMKVTGDDGILALRRSVAVFHAIGLFAGLVLVARAAGRQNAAYLLLVAATLATWMFPRHKLFDITLSLLLVGALTFLIERPTARRHFLTGVGIGPVACFGRNHGLYGAVGSVGALLWLHWGRPQSFVRGALQGGAGILVGYLPVLGMVVAVPGFADAFLASIIFHFEFGTNLTLPVPWPWRVDYGAAPTDAMRAAAIGLMFVTLAAVAVLSLAYVIGRRLRARPVAPVLVAAAWLILPYAHYAFSRADTGHLALGLFPFLVFCLGFVCRLRPLPKWSLTAALFVASAWVVQYHHPGWWCRDAQGCTATFIGRDSLRVDPGTAAQVAMLNGLAARYAPGGRAIVVAPFWPSVYPLLGRRSPTWEICALAPRPPAFEAAEVARIEAANPGFVLVHNVAVDGVEARRFQHTHPLTFAYLTRRFERVPVSTDPDDIVFVNRAAR